MTKSTIALSERIMLGGIRADTLARSVLFIAIYLFFWISATPFRDLSDPVVLQPLSSSGILSQVIALSLGGLSVLFIYTHHERRLGPLCMPILIPLLLWFGLTVVLSAYPDIAGRRYCLALIEIVMAMALLFLPRNERHFGDLIAVSTLIFLLVCYLGVAFFPQLSLHQYADLLEPQLAGAWRGLFLHKNLAGAAMVVSVFIGLYLAKTRNLFVGGLIVVLSVIFLVFTLSKTCIVLLPVILAMSAAFTAIHSSRWRLVLALGGLFLFNLATLGSAVFLPVHNFLEGFTADPSYTNRDGIWRFAFDQLAKNPWIGAGFQAFWRTSEVIYSGSNIETWANQASDGHNDYLDAALTTGIPGLVLTIMWLIVSPVGDASRSAASGNDSALTNLFVRIWLFSIARGCLESTFFTGGNPCWFMMLISIFGLRLQGSLVLISGASTQNQSPKIVSEVTVRDRIEVASEHKSAV